MHFYFHYSCLKLGENEYFQLLRFALIFFSFEPIHEVAKDVFHHTIMLILCSNRQRSLMVLITSSDITAPLHVGTNQCENENGHIIKAEPTEISVVILTSL